MKILDCLGDIMMPTFKEIKIEGKKIDVSILIDQV